MANTLFANQEELLSHLVSLLPVSQARGAGLFRDFQESGYLARQENTGITVVPKLWGGTVWATISEGATDAHGHVQVVMLSHPSLDDDEFDSWVGVVQGWAANLPPQAQGAISRKIRLLKHVEHGIPLTVLHDGMPAGLLLSYRRPADFVLVIDSPVEGRRRIYTTKGIG
jgi:hypothetical protein